ncbi:MAG: hypothetical protein RL265_947 [Bacteroidota bacterium]|jgi:WD40 repeat protein
MIFEKRKEFTGHAAGIYSLAYDGEFLYSGSADRFVTRWNLISGIQDKFSVRFEFPVYAIALLNENKFLAVGLSTGDLHIFNLEQKQEIKFFTQHKKAIFTITENKLKKHFYCADADGNFSIWNSQTFDLLLYLPMDCGKIRRINVSKDGSSFSLAGQDGFIRVFETEFFNEIATFQAHKEGATAVLFHPKNTDWLLSGGKDALLKCWNWKTGNLLSEIPAHNFVIYDIFSLNDGNQLVTGSRDKTLKVWNTDTLSFSQRLDLKEGGHRNSVNCMLKLTENAFVSGSDDKRIIFWEVEQEA